MSKPIPSATVATSAFISLATSASSSASRSSVREVGVVGAGIDALRAQERRDALRVGDGQAVDDAAPRHPRELLRQPGEPLRLVLEHDRIELRASARASGPRRIVAPCAELLGDVVDDPVVGGGRRGQDGHARVERAEDPADAPVVGPEVVAPVGDAVRLVHDEQADGALDGRAGRRS